MENYQNLEQGIGKLRKPLSLEQVNFSILAPYNNILNDMSQVYIFGCKQLGKKIFDSCVTAGVEVIGFIDNDISIQGKEYCGRKIYALEEIDPKSLAVIVIASTTHEYIINCQLTSSGFTKVVGYPVLSIFDPIHFFPESVYKNMQADIVENSKHYFLLYDSLADQESKRTLDGLINYRLTLNPCFLKEVSRENKQPEYFDKDIVKVDREEVFVDGGGYDGDTVLKFLRTTDNQYRKIYFFEPDKELFLEAKDKLSEFNNIVFWEAAIYSQSDTLNFKTSGGLDGSIDNNGDMKVKALALDECIKEKITFLKLDVEGAESAALIGAKQHIKLDSPTLALSGYHNPQDIWQLPELIMSLNQDYQIYLRHYSNTSYETIIYVIPYKKNNAIIFDMDGVLFPTEDLKFKAYRDVFKNLYGIDIKETPERLGLSETKAMELFLNIYNKQNDFSKIPELIQRKRETYYNILEKQDFSPIEGVEDFLKIIKDNGEFKMGLATSSNLKSTEILIKKFGFEKYFDSILSLENVVTPKPDPEIYLTSAKLLDVDPSCCVVFEDSPTGLEAAVRAGMFKIGVATRISKEQIQNFSDLVINDFREINIEEIKKLLNSSQNKC